MKKSFELQCYDVITLSDGEIGVVLPDPLNRGMCAFYGDSWDQIECDGAKMACGIYPVVTVHRGKGTYGFGSTASIACSLGCNGRQRHNTTDGLTLVYEAQKPLKLGEYDAQFVGEGEDVKLKVGCQEITRQQIEAVIEAVIEAFKKLA